MSVLILSDCFRFFPISGNPAAPRQNRFFPIFSDFPPFLGIGSDQMSVLILSDFFRFFPIPGDPAASRRNRFFPIFPDFSDSRRLQCYPWNQSARIPTLPAQADGIDSSRLL
jgi:hypothetical protein